MNEESQRRTAWFSCRLNCLVICASQPGNHWRWTCTVTWSSERKKDTCRAGNDVEPPAASQIGGDSLVVWARYITAIRGDNKMSAPFLQIQIQTQIQIASSRYMTAIRGDKKISPIHQTAVTYLLSLLQTEIRAPKVSSMPPLPLSGFTKTFVNCQTTLVFSSAAFASRPSSFSPTQIRGVLTPTCSCKLVLTYSGLTCAW